MKSNKLALKNLPSTVQDITLMSEEEMRDCDLFGRAVLCSLRRNWIMPMKYVIPRIQLDDQGRRETMSLTPQLSSMGAFQWGHLHFRLTVFV